MCGWILCCVCKEQMQRENDLFVAMADELFSEIAHFVTSKMTYDVANVARSTIFFERLIYH